MDVWANLSSNLSIWRKMRLMKRCYITYFSGHRTHSRNTKIIDSKWFLVFHVKWPLLSSWHEYNYQLYSLDKNKYTTTFESKPKKSDTFELPCEFIRFVNWENFLDSRDAKYIIIQSSCRNVIALPASEV